MTAYVTASGRFISDEELPQVLKSERASKLMIAVIVLDLDLLICSGGFRWFRIRKSRFTTPPNVDPPKFEFAAITDYGNTLQLGQAYEASADFVWENSVPEPSHG